MTVERTFQGAWRISGIVDGHYYTSQYFGYTKREAIALWKREAKEKK